MSDPFNSEYAPDNSTNAGVAPAASAATHAQGVKAEPPPAGAEADRALGFEAKLYGVGKPRRIVIKGKIARD